MSKLHKQQIAVPIYLETLLSLLFISAVGCKPQFCLVGSSLSCVHFLHRIGTAFIFSGWAGSFFNVELLASKTQNKKTHSLYKSKSKRRSNPQGSNFKGTLKYNFIQLI